jgi:hypothetical protein
MAAPPANDWEAVVTRVLFVNGFNRSGTTLVTAALTDAAQATTLTVGHLARHLPSVDRFLRASRKRASPPDRGVDRHPVEESTPEEYGWLLHAKTGEFAFGPGVASAVLRDLVAELDPDGDTVVVLKNPWDTGREQLLLDHFPDSRVVLVRRRLDSIEDSVERAWERLATSTRYVRALIGDHRRAAEFLAQLLDPDTRLAMVRETQRKTRRDALRLAASASKLPPDRVAFLSYDELRDDPRTGAAWAAHLLDPEAFGKSIAVRAFPEYNRASSGNRLARAIDSYWARAWRRARARQVRAGILSPPDRRRPR